ncbi:MAG: glycosyltransferase family 4 protein [Cycloclasticus sp.]|nr:glycosyltransferase family 4 protein [Cycloclasticus sp.]
MNVLIIASLWPEPTSSAAGRRMMNILTLFHAQGWALTYACTAAESEYCYPLESLGIRRQTIEVNDAKFDEFIKELSPNIVLYDRFMVEEQFSWRVELQCPKAMTMLETSDLHCLRQARQKALKNGQDFKTNDLMNEVAYREIASILRTDLTLIISKAEVALLKSIFKVDEPLLIYFPFIVDPDVTQKSSETWPSYEEREGFMSIGNFKHAPNWDAVQYLKSEIWPLIRQKLPTAELFIYGAYPPPKAIQLNKPKEGFYIKGRAEEVKEVMQKARVCLAPLRFGAGLKGKLLEAMEFGTPSITTSVGAEAMHDDLPWNGYVVDTPQDIADAAVLLYTDKSEWKVCQTKGVDILNRCYSPTEFLQSLIDRVLYVGEHLTAHRQQNFQGGMLKYHFMKSTKYMSLWIEEKNKGTE